MSRSRKVCCTAPSGHDPKLESIPQATDPDKELADLKNWFARIRASAVKLKLSNEEPPKIVPNHLTRRLAGHFS
jgi:hypothetical protein